MFRGQSLEDLEEQYRTWMDFIKNSNRNPAPPQGCEQDDSDLVVDRIDVTVVGFEYIMTISYQFVYGSYKFKL